MSRVNPNPFIAKAQKSNTSCAIEGCEKRPRGRGLCSYHYRKWYQHGDPLYRKRPIICKQEGCSKKHYCYGFCRDHYMQASMLKHKFGMSVEDYNQMLEEQDHRCAICGIHESEKVRKLAVDHNHETGMVRGLLCNNCNTAIGMLGDNPEILEKAIKYIKGRV